MIDYVRKVLLDSAEFQARGYGGENAADNGASPPEAWAFKGGRHAGAWKVWLEPCRACGSLASDSGCGRAAQSLAGQPGTLGSRRSGVKD